MHTISKQHNKIKVLIAMFFAVIFAAFGDISLSKGMKIIGAADPDSWRQALLMALVNPYVLAGVGFLLVFLTLYLISLSWESLSYVLPLTAADYILVTLLAFYLLHEPVSPLRWIGSVFVAFGIALVART
jgi:drug/metabolite transporter (DMT)-like permease